MLIKFSIFSQIMLILLTLSHCGVLSEAKDPLNQEQRDYNRYGDGQIRESVERSREGKSSFMDLIGSSMERSRKILSITLL